MNQVILEACENARRLTRLCELLGLGHPTCQEIPELLEQFEHDHRGDDDPLYFWELEDE